MEHLEMIEPRKILYVSGFLLSLFALLSCQSNKYTQISSRLQKSNCNQQLTPLKYDLPKPIHEVQIDSLLVKNFSFQSLNAANAIGILDLLKDFMKQKQSVGSDKTIENKIIFIELTQKIYQKINAAFLEISALAAEMDCEEERADQIAVYLKGKEDDTETKLTVGAIVIGAAGGITAAVMLAKGGYGNTPEFIGIGTGLTEAILGISILLSKRKVDFFHQRNALKDIWEGPEFSAIFPGSIWYYLNYENPAPTEKSLRRQLVDKWLGFGQIAETKQSEREKLYKLLFGSGGKYTADQLTNRANMLDQIESHINLMKQDLKQLTKEVEKVQAE